MKSLLPSAATLHVLILTTSENLNCKMKFRKATEKDVLVIVEMIADDELGKKRENFQIPLPLEYLRAFEKINADENQELIVVENEDLEIIGTLQLSFIQYLTYRGGIRAQIEAVRIRKDKRGFGIGKIMFEWAINRAKERKAHLIQLYPSENGLGLFCFLLWAIPALKICCDTQASKQIFALALPIIKSHKLSQTTFRRV